MFGHHDDVITEDQKDNAQVTISDNDLSAITTSDNNSPIVDNGQASSNDSVDETPTPPLATTSVDGFSAPNAKLSSPFDYIQDNSSPASTSLSANRPYLQDSSTVNSTQDQQDETETDSPPEPQQKTSEDVSSDLPVKIVDEPKPLAQTSSQPQAATDDDSDEDDTEQTEQKAPVSKQSSDNLLSIKEKALGELSPLINNLELTPENKFQTLMMLIHESDNDKLIADAYAAAKAIPDEKARAQALLDIVNEINYFIGG